MSASGASLRRNDSTAIGITSELLGYLSCRGWRDSGFSLVNLRIGGLSLASESSLALSWSEAREVKLSYEHRNCLPDCHSPSATKSPFSGVDEFYDCQTLSASVTFTKRAVGSIKSCKIGCKGLQTPFPPRFYCLSAMFGFQIFN